MISCNWQLWNELEFHVSEETDQEDRVDVFAKRWEQLATCFVDDDADKGKHAYNHTLCIITKCCIISSRWLSVYCFHFQVRHTRLERK